MVMRGKRGRYRGKRGGKARAPATVPRRCLKCRKTFKAERNQFLCGPCKKTDTWREGHGILGHDARVAPVARHNNPGAA